ncbi:MAG TPA: histidine phosphatase family protein [Anaerolineae bacterium]|nr:histidine phosphatase family protein [Anaerolineae bacterium]
MNRLFWVRHGETLANIIKVFSYEQLDQSLTPKGILQAEQTAEYFKNKQIDGIYSSPLKRAIETAKIIAAPITLDVVLIEEFLEVNVGEFDGQPMRGEIFSVHQEIIDDWFHGKFEARFPGGEDYIELWERMRKGYVRIFGDHDNRNVIVVAHGGGFMYTLKELCRNADSKILRDAQIHNCSISEIILNIENERPQGELISIGFIEHLYGYAAEVIPGLPAR